MLSCNTGEGHNSTAGAIREVLVSRGVECEIIDVLSTCISPKFSKFISNWHTRIYKYAPKLWDVSYRASDRLQQEMVQSIAPDDRKNLRDIQVLGAKKLRALLERGNFDAVVCVHVFSGMMMSEVRAGGLQIPCFFVATDYTCSPLVDQCDADAYLIPAADLTEEFVLDGLPREKLVPTGIPTRQEFYSFVPKEKARAALDLPAEGMVVLMMCGSMGCGPMKKIAKKLSERLPQGTTLVAFCGRNEKLLEDLQELGAPNLRPMGYTTEIPLYMDAADMILTKPGGLSSTEAANKHLPMVLINAVGGCEDRNYRYFLTHGYALGGDESREVTDLVADLACQKEQLARMRRLLETDFDTNSAARIADHIMKAAGAPV